jgi:hypothetical protein
MVGALVLAVVVLLILVWALVPREVPWANALTRLNPGTGDRAEWMAPETVVRAVKRDFLATQAWLAAGARDWGSLARELEQYTTGAYLRRQRNALGLLVQTRGPRLGSVQTAEHGMAVRHFSADGLRCVLVDWQRERQLSTYHYWSGRLVHTQRLPEVVVVWQMVYDTHDRRWKVARLVQSLPKPATAGVRLSLADKLPTPAGRDY